MIISATVNITISTGIATTVTIVSIIIVSITAINESINANILLSRFFIP